MFNISEAYKIAINSPGREFKSRITFSNNTIDDNFITNIIYNSAIVSDDDFEIGTATMAATEIELIDEDYTLNYNFEDIEIKVETAVKLSDDSFEYVPLGLFTIDKCLRNNKKINLSASDRMNKFETPYISTLVYPVTLLQIAQDVCAVAGVQLLNTSFPNSDYIVNSMPVLDNVTCRKAIAQIAELAGGYARITRDGKLEIFNITTTIKNSNNYASSDDFISSGGFFIADELIAGTIEVNRDNYITLTSKGLNLSMIDKVIVKLGSEIASMGTGENPYYIVDNIFCQNPNSVINNLYNVLNGLSYMPFKANWQGNPAIDCGDMITINTGNGYYNTIATSRKLTYTGGLREEYVAVGKSNTEKQSTPKGSLTIDMENNKVEIKVLKDGIEQTVAKGEYETYVAQTAETLTSKVSRGDDLKTEVTQNADSWKLSINGKLSGTNYNFTGDSFKIGDNTGGSTAEHSPGYSKWQHSDGSYTKASADGLEKFIAGTGKKYHSLMTAGSATVAFGSDVIVTLGEEFKNKDYIVIASVKSTLNDVGLSTLINVGTFGAVENKANGTIRLSGLCSIQTNDSSGNYVSTSIYKSLYVSYIVIA